MRPITFRVVEMTQFGELIQVVEVLRLGDLVATIYPDGDSIQVLSRCFAGVERVDNLPGPVIPSIFIRFRKEVSDGEDKADDSRGSQIR